jgi:hypothetical protein
VFTELSPCTKATRTDVDWLVGLATYWVGALDADGMGEVALA